MKKWIVPITLGTVLILSGCGASQSSKPEPAKTGTEQTNQKESASTSQANAKDGISKMKAHVAEFQKALTAGDQAAAKTHAEKIEESWASFEDTVKEKYKDYYEKVEEPLGIIQSGIKQATLDKKTLTDAATKLDGVLKELGDKVS